MSGRPSLAVAAPLKLSTLDLFLKDIDVVNNTDRRSIFGRRLELGIG